MKTKAAKLFSGLLVSAFMLLYMASALFAQIPQNIQVEGEVDDGWSLVFYLLALVIIILGIFLVGKYLKRKK